MIRALLAAAALASSTIAAAAPAPAPPPAQASELARQLVPKEMWAKALDQLGQNVRARLEGHPGSALKYPADLPSKIRTELETVLPYEDLVGMHAKQIGSSYTEPETKELLAFFRTPAGKKWLAVQPTAFENVSAETQKRFEEKLPAILQRLAKEAQPPAGAASKPPAHGAKAPPAKAPAPAKPATPAKPAAPAKDAKTSG